MKKVVGVLSAAVLLCGISTARAQGDMRSDMEARSKQAISQLRTATVTVKKVDPQKHRVTFEAQVSPEAAVTEEGRRIKIDDLKEGDSIRAAFDPRTGEVIAVQVVPSSGRQK